MIRKKVFPGKNCFKKYLNNPKNKTRRNVLSGYIFTADVTAQKRRFTLRIFSVNVTKFAGNFGFGHIY